MKFMKSFYKSSLQIYHNYVDCGLVVGSCFGMAGGIMYE